MIENVEFTERVEDNKNFKVFFKKRHIERGMGFAKLTVLEPF